MNNTVVPEFPTWHVAKVGDTIKPGVSYIRTNLDGGFTFVRGSVPRLLSISITEQGANPTTFLTEYPITSLPTEQGSEIFNAFDTTYGHHYKKLTLIDLTGTGDLYWVGSATDNFAIKTWLPEYIKTWQSKA